MAEKPKSFIERIIQNPITQTIVIFVSGGWIILEITEYFIGNFGLNAKARIIVLIILLCILPIALYITWYIRRRRTVSSSKGSDKEYKEAVIRPNSKLGRIMNFFRKPRVLIPSILILTAILITTFTRINHQSKVRWAREEATPQIIDYYYNINYQAALEMAIKAEKYIPDDTLIFNILSAISRFVSIQTDPPGADIYFKDYSDIDGGWKYIGKSNINSHRMPIRTFYRWKIVKEGYDTVLAVATPNIDTLFRKLDKTGTIPDGMVRVSGTMTDFGSVPDFFIDRYEVSNKEYKEFLEAGGYENSEYWKYEFKNEGQILKLEDAMDEFRDLSGRFGPSTWQAGDYPDNEDNYPVTGISWYEAMAYAEFSGKSLPTYVHWGIAAGFYIQSNSRFISNLIPLSNFNTTRMIPSTNSFGMNSFGAVNMAGNVKEWCYNESGVNRFIRGGANDDVNYMYGNLSILNPLDRSRTNGFRCVSYLDIENIPDTLFQPRPITNIRNFYEITPASDEVFQVYQHQFQYDKKELEENVFEIDSSNNDWTIEKVSFNAAYENDRVIAYLYLPKKGNPPYQTVIYFPGSGAINNYSIEESSGFLSFLDFFVKNGRAVLWPIYWGTYERYFEGSKQAHSTSATYAHTEHVIKVTKDVSRSIDYLECRSDIDHDKLAYLGFSWGGRIAPIVLSVEDRLKVGILRVGGFSSYATSLPEVDPINYVSRVTIPIIMLNGKYDYTFPFEATVKPMFDLFGTRESDKRLKLYESHHNVPKNEFIKESLNWLDTYLGPVK